MASMKFQPHMLVQCVPSIRSRQNAKNMLFVAICKSHLRAPSKIISIHPSIYLPILSYPTLPYPILSHPILSYLSIHMTYTYTYTYIHIYIYIYIFIDLLIYVFIFLLGKRQLPLLTVVPVCASALHREGLKKS